MSQSNYRTVRIGDQVVVARGAHAGIGGTVSRIDNGRATVRLANGVDMQINSDVLRTTVARTHHRLHWPVVRRRRRWRRRVAQWWNKFLIMIAACYLVWSLSEDLPRVGIRLGKAIQKIEERMSRSDTEDGKHCPYCGR